MTISTEVRKAGPFIGNDSASVFPFAFKVFKAADLIVVRRQDNIGTETTLVLDSDYHVTLNSNQDTTPGGVVTLVAGALASGFTLVVSSELPYLQTTDLTNQGGFYPKVITNALDRLTIFCQQLAEITGRTLKLPITAPTDISAEIPLPNPSELIAWDETGTRLTTVSPQSLVTSIAYGSATADLFAGDGVTTTFPLSTNPASVNNLDVSIDGHSQRPVQEGVGDYSWNGGATITFVEPPPAPTVPGDKNVLVRYMQAIPVSDSEALHAQTREALRRGYAEAGYTLVAGSFETGGTLTAAADVLLQESTGAAYAWTGALPKVVAPGFDPIGVVGFELRTDVALRSELTSGGATIADISALPVSVESFIGISKSAAEIVSNLDQHNVALAHGTIEVPSGGLGLRVGTKLAATGQSIVLSSANLVSFSGTGWFNKSNNTPVTITNPNDAAQTATVDSILYVSDEVIGKVAGTEVWGNHVTISDVALHGNATTPNEYGIYMLFGGNLRIFNTQIHRTKYAIYLHDVFLSNIFNVYTWGAIQQMGGTSSHYDNVWARGHLDVVGAFHFENLNYSVLDSCCSDRPRRSAFYFNNCYNITLNSCATEGPGYFNNLTDTQGGAVIFDTGNRVTLNNFQISPLVDYTGPLITVGKNNNIIIDRLFTNNGIAYTSADIYVHGNDSFVEIKAAQVRIAKNLPVIHMAPGINSKVVVWLNGGNRAILTAGATKEAPNIEYEYEYSEFTPTLLIGGSSTGITYTAQSGKVTKTANTVRVDFSITLSSKGTGSGNVTLGGFPYSVPALTNGDITSWTNVMGGPFTLGAVIAGAGNTITVRKTGVSSSAILQASDLSNDSILSGTFTYQRNVSGFNYKPA